MPLRQVQSTTEFTNAPVPQEARISWWSIALIKIGVVLALPGFLIGAQIGSSMGLRDGAVAFISGAAILAALAASTGTVGSKCHLPTAVIVQFAFGRSGARLINLVLAVTLVGWFAVTAEIFGNSLAQMSVEASSFHIQSYLAISMGGVLMVVTTMFGFKAISRLADLAVPLLLLLLLVVAWLATREHSIAKLMAYPGSTESSLGIGISAVVGGASAGTIIFPDLARFACNKRHGQGAAIFTYGICLPLMFIMIAIASVATGESDIIRLMLKIGLGGVALAFLVFKAWTTNVGNLYSSSLFFVTLFQKLPFRLVVAVTGALGTLGAIFGLTQHLVPFLLVLGVTIPPIAGVYVTDFYLRGGRFDLEQLNRSPDIPVPAFVAWLTGITLGALGSMSIFSLTRIPTCDSILAAATVYFGLKRLERRWTQSQNEGATSIASIK